MLLESLRDILTMKRNPIALKPYTSVDESRFFRGAAINLAYKKLDLLLSRHINQLMLQVFKIQQ